MIKNIISNNRRTKKSVLFLFLIYLFFPLSSMASWPNLRDRDVARQKELRSRISEIQRERPRIFLTNSEIETVRNRIDENSSIREAYQWLTQFSYGGQYFHNLWDAPKKLQGLVVAYRLEGKPQEIFKNCIDCMDYLCDSQPDSWTYPRAVRGLSMAYDWLYDDLTETQKQKYGKQIIEYAKACYNTWKHSELNNHVYLEYGPILYAGIALLDEGIDDEAVEQLLLDGMQLLLDQFIPAHEQLARDGGWYESMSYHAFFTYEYAHLLELWQHASGERVWDGPGGLQGDANWLVQNARPWDDTRVHVADLGGNNSYDLAISWYLPLLWKHHNDGVARYWTDYIRTHNQNATSRGYMWWPYIVWGDVDVPATSPKVLQVSRHFRGVGWTTMRSSWDKNASFALFICSDWWGGHQHCDNNSFVIHKRAPLIIDSGIYDAGSHRANYSARSVAHNTITVYDPNEKFFGGTWGQSTTDATVNDGGQLYTPSPSGVDVCTPGSKYDRGNIISYKNTPMYTYTVGDATKSYLSSKVNEFKRAFIQIRPDLFIVFDRVESSDATFKKRWLMHAINEPTIDNKTVTIKNIPGTVTCQTVYPKNVQINTIGGAGHEFDVNGTNFPSSKNDPEAGSWRVEISPESPAKREYFLHVLRTAEFTAVTPEVELLESEDSLGVRITDNDQTYEMHFTLDGVLKSRISIKDIDGKTIVNDQITALLPKILKHPQNNTIEPETDSKFYIHDNFADAYQWQVNTGNGFMDISDNSVYSGAHTDTLSITDASLDMSKYAYRCIISNSSDTLPSNEAILTVTESEKPEITSTHPNQVLTANADCQAVLPDYTTDVVATDNYTEEPIITQSPEAGSLLSGNSNTITLTATDESGNSAIVTFNVKVNDTISPTISCPENQVRDLSEGKTVYMVNGAELDPLETTDNCGIVNLTNDFNHSSTLQLAEFPEGTTTVNWIAEDLAGNQTQCTMDVTVSDYVDVETLKQKGISVYPNPAKGKIYFESSNQSIRNIKISDLAGKTFVECRNPNQHGTIDMSGLSNGIYNIRISTENDLFIYKIILAG